MSLLDVSLIMLLSIPFIFFMGTAWMYCRQARDTTVDLAARNTQLRSQCDSLRADCQLLESCKGETQLVCSEPNCPKLRDPACSG